MGKGLDRVQLEPVMPTAFRLFVLFACLRAFPASAINPGLGPTPATVERDSPSATVHGFLNEAHAGHYEVAAHYLFLDFLPREVQAVEGPRLARRLKFVLDRKVWIDFSQISREPSGEPTHPLWDQIGAIPLGNTNQPLRVTHFQEGEGEGLWVFSPETVKAIDRLYGAYGPPFGDFLPDVFFRYPVLQLEPWQWLGFAALLLLAIALGWLAEKVALALGRRAARLTLFKWDDLLVEAADGPLRLPILALVLSAGERWLLLTPSAQRLFEVGCRTLFIVSIAWMLLRVLDLWSQSVGRRALLEEGVDHGSESHGGESGSGLRLQGLRTQISVLQRLAGVAVYLVASALILTQFEVVRHLGVSLLASAGVAGLVLGVAAQRSISALLAGLQLSLTRPILLGDTVVVEGESGIVEEITLTYVVMRLWDQRRMVIPMNYFLEKPFQNWSKGGNSLMATALVRTRYTADIEAFRQELRRTLESDAKPLWDGKVPNLLVTEAPDRTLLLRAIAYAAQPAATFELRRVLQQRLEALLRTRPEWLPPSALSSRPPPGNPSEASH